ncbi:hypothetical protein [Taibaiella soli]|uniref:Uncharacterized protein n=1 Tax=Taibaiella soli TaxID=1649169 RepID=A0A2W2BCW7_9BACT|nr:hypothetical protein [Taibaiella soli]PZF73707.1 hypothetical protein DN068_06845 [Taibaiella soli]
MAITNQYLGTGHWAYRSFKNDPDLSHDLTQGDNTYCPEFGQGILKLVTHPDGTLTGTIGGPGWELKLQGSVQLGNPATLWFRGSGVVSGAPWIYDYLCYVVPHIPEGVDQVPALVGSVTRAIAHPGGDGKTNPAGVVASFFAVYQGS